MNLVRNAHLIDLKLMTEHAAIDIVFNFSFQVTNAIALICERSKWIFNMHLFLFITFLCELSLNAQWKHNLRDQWLEIEWTSLLDFKACMCEIEVEPLIKSEHRRWE